MGAAKAAIQMWKSDATSTLAWLQGMSREDLVELLEGLSKGLAPADQSAITKALGVAARDVLRKRNVEKRKRDFVRFMYGNRLAADLKLPSIFHDPEVYRLHPEPEVGAAIMVVHRFAPQIAQDLFNYSTWSAQPQVHEDLGPRCPCHSQVRPGATLVDGHVLSTDVSQLKSPYLQDILGKGKKFRLEQPLSSVLPRLREGLQEYVEYKVRKSGGDSNTAAALTSWMATILEKAHAALTASAVARHPLPDGFPGLREQLQAAKTALVFGPEDRAPHAVFFACGRSYATKLHNRLSEGGAFCLETRPPADVMAALAAFNTELGTQHRDRVPYLYGSWKAKKGTFRWIAGTSRKVGSQTGPIMHPPVADAGDEDKEVPQRTR